MSSPASPQRLSRFIEAEISLEYTPDQSTADFLAYILSEQADYDERTRKRSASCASTSPSHLTHRDVTKGHARIASDTSSTSPFAASYSAYLEDNHTSIVQDAHTTGSHVKTTGEKIKGRLRGFTLARTDGKQKLGD